MPLVFRFLLFSLSNEFSWLFSREMFLREVRIQLDLFSFSNSGSSITIARGMFGDEHNGVIVKHKQIVECLLMLVRRNAFD